MGELRSEIGVALADDGDGTVAELVSPTFRMTSRTSISRVLIVTSSKAMAPPPAAHHLARKGLRHSAFRSATAS